MRHQAWRIRPAALTVSNSSPEGLHVQTLALLVFATRASNVLIAAEAAKGIENEAIYDRKRYQCIEAVVMAAPDAEAILIRRREAIRVLKARAPMQS
jgi:hypothetical protein